VTTTSSGFRRRACSITMSDDEPTASAVTRYLSGSASTTSIVCVPMDPEDPAIATRVMPKG
jgi:hypothetical protein